MKINKVFVIIIFLGFLILPAVAEQCRVAKDHQIGCVEKDDYKRMVSYAIHGDMVSFQQALTEGLKTGTFTQFKLGEPVYLEDTSFWEALVKLRRPGETASYWTATDTVKC